MVIDDGQYLQAELETVDQPMSRRWCWTAWRAQVPVPQGLNPGDSFKVAVKAVDDAYNSQPAKLEDIWNLRGCLNNTHHTITVNINPSRKESVKDVGKTVKKQNFPNIRQVIQQFEAQ